MSLNFEASRRVCPLLVVASAAGMPASGTASVNDPGGPDCPVAAASAATGPPPGGVGAWGNVRGAVAPPVGPNAALEISAPVAGTSVSIILIEMSVINGA